MQWQACSQLAEEMMQLVCSQPRSLYDRKPSLSGSVCLHSIGKASCSHRQRSDSPFKSQKCNTGKEKGKTSHQQCPSFFKHPQNWEITCLVTLNSKLCDMKEEWEKERRGWDKEQLQHCVLCSGQLCIL